MLVLNDYSIYGYLKRNNAKYLNSGSDALAYKVGNRVFRWFYNPRQLTLHNINSCLKFKDVSIKNFLFADEISYYPFKINGEFMPYAPGIRLSDNSLYKEDIDKASLALERLSGAIIDLSDAEISVGNDIAPRNTIYDGTDFYFIDTGDYGRGEMDIDKIWQYNRRTIMLMLYRQILDLRDVYAFAKCLYGFGSLYGSDILYLSPREILVNIKNKLEEYLDEPISSFEQADRIFARKRGI